MALYVKTWKYTWDWWTTKTISWVWFQPKVVIIGATSWTWNDSAAHFKTDDMPTWSSSFAACMDASNETTSWVIDSITSSWFIVRWEKNLNWTDYYYICFWWDDCYTWTYTWDWNDNRWITWVWFEPALVVIKWLTTISSYKTTETKTSDIAFFFNTTTSASNVIQSLDSDWFTLWNKSSHSNVNWVTYYYFCLKQTTNSKYWSYTGNWTDNRNLTWIWFDPTFFFTWISWLWKCMRTSWHSWDLTSRFIANTAPSSNLIQSFITWWVQLWSDDAVNWNFWTPYYYWAFIDEVPVATWNIKKINSILWANSKKNNNIAVANNKKINNITA